MSFALTTPQFLDGSKTVTRRLGWTRLRAGDQILAVEKCMGLKKGEKQVPLGVIEIVDVRREALEDITADDVIREGFPDMTRAEFVTMFSSHMRVPRAIFVTRIEFRRLDEPKDAA